MTNTALFNHLWTGYHNISATDKYIMVFNYKKVTYMATVDAPIVPSVLKLDKASRGAGYALRFAPTADQKIALLPYAEVLCSTDYFNHEVSESKYNKGEIAEKLVTEKFGQTWEKDNIPFTEAGDINIDGVEYQIKFEKATFTNEKTLARLTK